MKIEYRPGVTVDDFNNASFRSREISRLMKIKGYRQESDDDYTVRFEPCSLSYTREDFNKIFILK